MATDDVQITDAADQLVAVATDVITTLNGADISGNSPQTEAQRVKAGFGGDSVFRDVDSTHGLPAELVAAIPAGGNGIGSVDVTSLPAIPAGSNTIGTVNTGTMPAANVSSDSIGVAPLAEVTLAGATPYKLNSAASTNATSVKGSAGKVFFMAVFNTNAAVRYIKFYNKASAPTVGTDTPVLTLSIPGNTAAAGFVLSMPMPVKFSAGIAFALTTGATDADTGAVAANEILVNLGYV